MKAASTPLRLFFALWPDSARRRELVARQSAWRWPPAARPTPADKLHLTLLFMDGVPSDALPAVAACGDAVAAHWREFALRLDAARVWPGSGIAHLAPTRPPPELLRLRDALAEQARMRELPFDPRAFSPHVTLARRAEGAEPPQVEPIDWPVRGFALVQSLLGQGRYKVLLRWPQPKSLTAPAAAPPRLD